MSATGLERLEGELRVIRELLERQLPKAAVTYEEAARLLSCSAKHLRRLVKRGELSTIPVGNLQRIPMSEIHRLTTPRGEVAEQPRVMRPAVSSEHRVRELMGLRPRRR